MMDRIPVVLMYRDGPGTIVVVECYRGIGDHGLVAVRERYSVEVGFDLVRMARDRIKEFGRLLRWVLRNDPDCDVEMWSPSSRSG